MPFRIDDIVFGISAVALGSAVAVTHGGTQPLFEPHPAIPPVNVQAVVGSVPPVTNVPDTVRPAIVGSVVQPESAEETPVVPVVAAPLPLTAPADGVSRHREEHEREREDYDDDD